MLYYVLGNSIICNINATGNVKKLFAKKIHADNRMNPKLTEFADIPWRTGVLYQVKLLCSKGLIYINYKSYNCAIF